MTRKIICGLLSVLLATALLAGCSDDGKPVQDTVAPQPEVASSPDPEPASTSVPSQSPEPFSLAEWEAMLPIENYSCSFEPWELTLWEGINWPEEGLVLRLASWNGTLQELADRLGITLEELEALNPDPMISASGDTYYQLQIQAEPYMLPKIPMQKVEVHVKDVMPQFQELYRFPLPADLDQQAAAVLATAQCFLQDHYGLHLGIEPAERDPDTGYYTVTEGALCTRYSQLEEYLGCLFTPEYYEPMLGGPTPEEWKFSFCYYQGENDTINFTMGDSGSNIERCGTVYTQPEIQEDGSILFWQLNLYVDPNGFEGYGEGRTYTPAEAVASPVRLVPTETGWRVAEYSLPR